MKFSYSTANLIFFGFLIILLILPIFDRHKIGKFQTQKSLLGIRLWAITYLPIKRARCLPLIFYRTLSGGLYWATANRRICFVYHSNATRSKAVIVHNNKNLFLPDAFIWGMYVLVLMRWCIWADGSMCLCRVCVVCMLNVILAFTVQCIAFPKLFIVFVM